MKKYIITLLLTVVTVTMMAVPAKRGLWKTLTLQDGTQVRATLVGDEHGHFWKAENGQAYIQKGDVYVTVDAQKTIAKAKARRAKVNAQRVQRRTFGHPTTILGHKKAIMILANFKDKKFQTSHDNALYQKIANQEGYSEGDFKGSMADYFKAQSRDKFTLDFDVVGPVTVSKNASYYGENDENGNDMYAGEMVCEAVNLAKEQVSNWKQYDWDGDGYVDQVYVVYAGKGAADGGDANTIWPHAYDLASANYYGDGTGPVAVGENLYVNSYACGGELNGVTGEINGIGTMCHEYSHCLGYPDFYDIDYGEESEGVQGPGMGSWDLMDGGSYNGNGFQPAGYTSYERWFAGWEEPIVLNAEDVNVTNMKSLQNDGEFYIIYNDKNANEYYLLENRQLEGWDASLPAAGLLILHCDYDAKVWENNAPNDDPNHQRFIAVSANGEYPYEIWKGNYYYDEAEPFPYGKVNAFNKNFKVKSSDKIAKNAAQFFTKTSNGTKWMNGSVEEITQNSDKTISFNYVANIGGVDPVTPTGDYLFYESFDQCDGTGGNDDLWNGQGTAAAAFNPDNDGWIADSKAGANQCAKFGSSKKVGTVTTPTISLTNQAVLTFKAAPWSGDATSLKLSATGATVTFDQTELTMTDGEWKTFTVNMTGSGDAKIVFTPGKRFFLDEVLVVDPNATAIQTINTNKTVATRIYTLDGRYVGADPNQLPRGLYIINGKKIVK